MKILALAAAMAPALSSCNFLEEIPTTALVTENVYTSENAAAAALQGCYRGLFYISTSPFLQYIQGASILQENSIGLSDSWFQHTVYSNNSNNASFYERMFSGITDCNSFIDDISASSLPTETKVTMVAEARFIRAFLYFFCVRIWGDLPILKNKITELDDANVPRSSYQEVYKFILDDLDYAEKHLKPRSSLTIKELQEGHFCNYSATAMKAKVYVQIASYMAHPDDQWFDITKTGRYPDFSNCGIPKDDVAAAWTLALNTAKDVIQNGPFSLEPDYANLFRFLPKEHPEDYLSPERIVVIPITVQVSSCAYSSWSLPKQPYGADQTTTDNGNKLRVRPSRYTWEKWCEKYDGKLEERNGNTIGPYHFYSGCPDPRLDATYYHTVYYTGSEAEGKKNTNHCYPYASSETKDNYVAYYDGIDVSFSSYNTSAALNSRPIYKKGFSKAYRGSGSGGDADIYLFRYADVLLLAAEAAANLSSSPTDNYATEAMGYVNQVLSRARKSTNKSSTYPHTFGDAVDAVAPADWKSSDYMNKDELLLAILWERVFEMDYEFQHFFDTRRYGARYYVENFVKPFNEFWRSNANIRVHEAAFMKYGRDKEEDMQTVRKGLLIAYPEYEILNNTALDYSSQNDFYIQ